VGSAAAFLVLLGWIAWPGLRRERHWAARVLTVAWIAVAATIVTTTIPCTRGLPPPTAGRRADGAGYGWQPLAVGLFAWASGLWLARTPRLAHEKMAAHDEVESRR
jgi:hypothetical protein